MKKIIAFDLDGTLCKSLDVEDYNGMTTLQYLDIEPIKKNIKKVQYAKQRGYKIAIYSSRHWALFEITKRWLRKWSIPYDIIVLGKYLADCYIDNKNVNYKPNWSMKRIIDRLEQGEK